MAHRTTPTLIVIGGHEDKEGPRIILREVARHIGDGKLVVTTVASSEPEGLFDEYERVFRNVGIRHVFKLPIASRAEARREANVRVLDGATGVFFTGGDQLKITSQIGDTPIFRRIQEIHHDGGVIAGTSAGASVLCETMLVAGESESSPRVSDSVQMAPGLGLFPGVIVDQHFAERGRMGRLVGAVAQNPKILGLGIDENTAVVVERARRLRVLGDGAVYVVDGANVTDSNLTEEEPERTLSIFDVRLHLLSQGDSFDLHQRRPSKLPARGSHGELDVVADRER